MGRSKLGRLAALLGVAVSVGCAASVLVAERKTSSLPPSSTQAASASTAAAAAPAPAPLPPSSVTAAPALPEPPAASDNNLFGLVRPAGELAGEPEGVTSPDGKLVAWARGSEREPPSLWVSEPDGKNARQVLAVDRAQVGFPPPSRWRATPPRPLAESTGLSSLAFSPDAKRVYFLTDGWGTSLALYAAELDTGRARLVHDANGYTVIHRCKEARHVGRIIILEHRYFDPIPGSAVDWYFLIDAETRRHGIVGPEPANVARFLAKRCGIGSAPPDPPKPKLPRALAQGQRVCRGSLYSTKTIRFLDGTASLFVFAREIGVPGATPMALDAESADALLDFECAPSRR